MFGNGYCRHVHPLSDVRSLIKPARLGYSGDQRHDLAATLAATASRERQVAGGATRRRPAAPVSPKRSDAAVRAAHLPPHLVPPPGHSLQAAIATEDMYAAIDAAQEPCDKTAILITRCFEHGLYCDAGEWGPRNARAAAKHVFHGRMEEQRLETLQIIADEAVLLGYRAATPLDLSVILGQRPNDSWKPEFQALMTRAMDCC